MVCLRSGLWGRNRSCGRQGAELGDFVSLGEANEVRKTVYTEVGDG